MPDFSLVSSELLQTLADHAQAADAEPVWPEASWNALRRAGVLQWVIPCERGGLEASPIDLLMGYEMIASACLTTAFILSQREAACRRIRNHGSASLQAELLPKLASGRAFATVGLSQLTTSRQHGAPAMSARLDDRQIILDGAMPWVTGAAQADFLISGGMLNDGRQVLAVVPRETPGLEVGPPLNLMALAGSLTTEVRCREVVLDRQWLLAGPIERVLTTGRSDVGGLETSCLALGLTQAAIDYLRVEAAHREELKSMVDALQQTWSKTRSQLHDLLFSAASTDALMALRAEANTLVLRATQAALTASKGAGFLRDHPAQRWARQALFFLVWSCPRPAMEATLAQMVPQFHPECS